MEKKRTSFANRGRQMKTLSGTGEDLRGWDSRKQSGSGIFCLVIEARTFKFSLLEQKGCDIFCNVMDGLFWTCLLFRCDSYSSYVQLRFPRSLVWFKHNQLWIPVCRLWEAHMAFCLTRSVGGYLTPRVFTATALALSAVWSLHAQSPDLSRVTSKDSDRQSANHPVDLKYRPATKSHYTQ